MGSIASFLSGADPRVAICHRLYSLFFFGMKEHRGDVGHDAHLAGNHRFLIAPPESRRSPGASGNVRVVLVSAILLLFICGVILCFCDLEFLSAFWWRGNQSPRPYAANTSATRSRWMPSSTRLPIRHSQPDTGRETSLAKFPQVSASSGVEEAQLRTGDLTKLHCQADPALDRLKESDDFRRNSTRLSRPPIVKSPSIILPGSFTRRRFDLQIEPLLCCFS